MTQSPPFSHTGVDYAGPFSVTSYVDRGQKATKHYVALFVFLSTKAIHLESVDDYSTAAFLATFFQRFVAAYSVNGTNFQGADHELQRRFADLRSDPSVHDTLANNGVKWHFISVAVPHFGRFWEAGVKSFKFHFR